MTIKSLIRNIPDYPKKGVMFRDITTLIKDPAGFKHIIDDLVERYSSGNIKFDTIVGIESRGFIIGGALSYCLGMGFTPIRKKGKLPAATMTEEYALEYGTDAIEIHADALPEGRRAVFIDDVLATGGTAAASARLIRKCGAVLAGIAFVIELADLAGRQQLPTDVPVVALLKL